MTEQGLSAPPRDRGYEQTDLGNAEAFAALHHGRLRHVRERRSWLVWQDGRWRRDETGEADRAAKAVTRAMLTRAAAIEDREEQKRAVRFALASQSESRIRAMLALAATEPGLALAADALDADPFLLACPNGTLELRTGQLRDHRPEDLISLGTDVAYDAAARCPRWERFLEEVFDGDGELVGFVRRAVGYSICGDTREHVVFVCHGAGANGKTVFASVLQRIVGDFARTSPFETFTRKRGDGGTRNDIARLHRARLVIAAESGEGRRLDEAIVKALSGGDVIAARFLYGEYFEYRPQFKLWMISNHRPRVDGDDDAIWRRLRLLPFAVSFEGREDRDLADTLAEEAPGILAWAVRGCLEWQSDGLGLAAKVTDATAAYRADEDVLGSFLAERCELAGDVAKTDLRQAYEVYAKSIGETPLAANTLGRRLARRGIVAGGPQNARYLGLSLKSGEWST